MKRARRRDVRERGRRSKSVDCQVGHAEVKLNQPSRLFVHKRSRPYKRSCWLNIATGQDGKHVLE